MEGNLKKFLGWRKEYYFCPRTARKAVLFFERCCRHTKGRWAGQTFKLEPWQRRMVRRIFGWKRRDDHTRKFRVVFLFIPRKNGKSTIGAGLGLFLLHADNEIGAEIVSAAADSDQANIIFSMAKDMNDLDPLLSGNAKSFRRSLVVHKTGCSYKVISSVANTKHGGNLHGVLFDELHAQPNRELYDVLKTSTGARMQPLEIYITTAGYDQNSICYELYDYAKRVAEGTLEDPTFMPILFEADKDDDWTKEETWKKANPNYGVSIQKSYFEKEVRQALAKPAYENTFKRLHLNMWTESDVRALNMFKWKSCGDLPYSLDELAGKPCWLGMDLSSVNDFAALALVFRVDNLWKSILRFYLPRDTYLERKKKDRHPYDVWVRDGWLKITPGGRLDYAAIRSEINDLYTVYNIREIAVDPWNAHQLSTQLEKEDGFTVVQVRQSVFSLSAPTKEFISAVGEVQWAHGNNPVLTWHAGNLSTEEDAAGNLKPSKKASSDKIDGCVAIITALSRAVVALNEESVYLERGVLAF